MQRARSSGAVDDRGDQRTRRSIEICFEQPVHLLCEARLQTVVNESLRGLKGDSRAELRKPVSKNLIAEFLPNVEELAADHELPGQCLSKNFLSFVIVASDGFSERGRVNFHVLTLWRFGSQGKQFWSTSTETPEEDVHAFRLVCRTAA